MRFTSISAILIILIAAVQPAFAEGPITLNVQIDGPATAKVLSLEDLKAMGTTEITTTTPWTEGMQTFVGVSGAQLVAALKAKGENVLAVANNDYSIVVPFSVLSDPDTLIAYALNGAPMPVSDKGPLWIVFPFDKDAKFASESYKAYAIWGLTRLEFRAQ